MATARTFIHAAPEDIFNVLSNPGTYEMTNCCSGLSSFAIGRER